MYAAYLHDVGKLSIPSEILTKQEPLSSQEYHQLQSHPSAALTLLESWPFLKTASIWIAHHHERWDGSGYPNGLKGAFIPLGSRIIAIADTFDVLTVRNPEEAETAWDVCLSIIKWYSGSQFDPELMDIFSKLVPEWTTSRKEFLDNARCHDQRIESIQEAWHSADLANSYSLKP
ncbi:MAG: HD domain-containing phosphohydrolase [Nitrospirales bacterium]|nr:HD domain-containing phosphohydrolase [Nitrospirales bacterium]